MTVSTIWFGISRPAASCVHVRRGDHALGNSSENVRFVQRNQKCRLPKRSLNGRPEHLGPPVVETPQTNQDQATEPDVVEVRYHEIRIRNLRVEQRNTANITPVMIKQCR